MITTDCLNAVLPIVADSWDRLRKCDVYRLLDSIQYTHVDSINDAGKAIIARRPDLADEVEEVVSELSEEFLSN